MYWCTYSFYQSLCTLQIIKRVPQLKKLDGIPVDVDERDAAKAARG